MSIYQQHYRRWSGRLRPHPIRWWVICLGQLRVEKGKSAFWIVSALGWMRFVVIAGVMLFTHQVRSQVGSTIDVDVFKFSSFIREFMIGQDFFVFILMVMVGSGIVAKDAKANALQVYLSKPMTRLDYFLGKFAALAAIVLMQILLPGLLLFLLAWGINTEEGFLRENGWLVGAILLYSALAALVFGIMVLGLSSLSKNARYAGVYIVLVWIGMDGLTQAMVMATGEANLAPIAFSLSLETVGRNLFSRAGDITAMFGGQAPRGEIRALFEADWRWCLASLALYCVVAALVFWRRVRAVEVVR